MVAYPTRTLQLADGLRVVLESAPDFGVAGAVLLVAAGAADDPANRGGLAHLAEHVVFEARHRTGSLVSVQRERGPTFANAHTSWDDTTFFAFDDPGALPAIVGVLYDTVKQPLEDVDETVFQRERDAVYNEMRLRTEEGTPGREVGRLMAASFAPGHPYAHPVGGTSETLAGLTLADLQSFTGAHYKPGACTLVITAPLPLAELVSLVEGVTGQRAATAVAAAPHGPSRPRPVAPLPPPATLAFHEEDVASPRLWIGWQVPPVTGELGDLPPLIEALFEVQFHLDLARYHPDLVDARAYALGGVTAGLFAVEITLAREANPEEIVRRVADELAAVPPIFEEIKRVTTTHHLYREEDAIARAEHLAWSAEHLGAPTFLRHREQRMLRRSADAVTSFARTYLTAERAHAILVRPRVTPPAAVLASGIEVHQHPPRPDRAAPSLAGASSARPRVLLAGVEKHLLANGLEVILVPRPGSPFHTVLLGFRGGHAQAEPPGVPVAAAWSRLWERWTPNVWGIEYSNQVSADSTIELMRSTGKDVGATLEHLGHLVGFSSFWPPREFTERLTTFEREERMPRDLFERALAHAVFGEHSLGALPTASEIARIRPREVQQWVDRVRRPRNAALVIVGDFDPLSVLDDVQAQLGSWGADASVSPTFTTPSALETSAAPPASAARVILQDQPSAQEATLRVLCPLPRAGAESAAAVMLFNASVQRALEASLREEIGASYSVNSRIRFLVGGTAAFDLRADVDYAVLPQAIQRVRALLADPGTPFLTPATLVGGRPRAGLYARMDTEVMAREVFDRWNLGWPLDFLDRLPQLAIATSAAQVTAIAEHCRENAVIGVLGDRRRTQPAWSAAGR